VYTHFPAIAQALLIAVEALEDFAERERLGGIPTVPGHSAAEVVSHIRSLPLR